ncbi:MAG: PadR family transcriptional regulator [Chloroflexi bacterium]|nr:PadR family transcriptional regulator [Chloroflexota bacterium]
MNNYFKKYLPLTESTAYILLALHTPMHGYGVMQKVESLSEQTVKIGPGTLYGAFSTLEKEGLIVKVGEEGRRKVYMLTEKGKQLFKEHIRRSEILVTNGKISKAW